MELDYHTAHCRNQMKNFKILFIIYSTLLFKDINVILLLDTVHVSILILNIIKNIKRLIIIFIITPELFLMTNVLLKFIILIIIHFYLNLDFFLNKFQL